MAFYERPFAISDALFLYVRLPQSNFLEPIGRPWHNRIPPHNYLAQRGFLYKEYTDINYFFKGISTDILILKTEDYVIAINECKSWLNIDVMIKYNYKRWFVDQCGSCGLNHKQ